MVDFIFILLIVPTVSTFLVFIYLSLEPDDDPHFYTTLFLLSIAFTFWNFLIFGFYKGLNYLFGV